MGVFKRGKTWTARVFWRDQHKKRHSASQGGFKTKKEASDWFNDKNAELNKGMKYFTSLTVAMKLDAHIIQLNSL